jgi:hypothetical protein
MEKNVQLCNSFLTGILVGMAIITVIWIAGPYMDPRREAGEERMKHLFDVVIGNDKALKQLLAEVKKNEQELKILRILEEETAKNLNELLDVLSQMELRSDDKHVMCEKWSIRYQKWCKPSSKIYTGTGF